MLYGKKNQRNSPNYVMQQKSMDPNSAYRQVKDILLDEGVARQNLATFCQTTMEEEAVKLMGESLEKNAIDKSEYPRTAEIENRCVNIIANIWNAPADSKYIGTSTVGSSEACMLGGLAMKFRWRKLAEEVNLDIYRKKPNIVITSGFQVCWEKFCVYWDVELRPVPIDMKHMSLNIEKIQDYVDEYTIGVVGIQGITYTGQYDDIKALDKAMTDYNKSASIPVYIHVDGASGGLYTPFVEPDLVWDFRLKNVVSINTSGHKYGLVFPGVGWIVWRGEEYLPEELIFKVSYLGGDMPTMAINFSRSASQIIGQYYNFIRLGFEGYRGIHRRTRENAMYLGEIVARTGLFDMYNNGSHLPLVCYGLKEDVGVPWSLYDLADRLQMKGWQVPAYPLPANMGDKVIQRYVIRADFTESVVEGFTEDFLGALEQLKNAHYISAPKEKDCKKQGFTH